MGLFSLSAQVTDTRIVQQPQWRFSASGGLGYKTAKGSSSDNTVVNKEKVTQFNNSLRWTPTVNADVHYLFKSGWGLGVKYIFNYSSANATDLIIDINDNAHYVVGDAFEKVYINYVGLSVCGNQWLDASQKYMLFTSGAGGYANLRDEGGMFMNNVLITGGTYAVNYEIGIDYFLNPSFAIGLNAGFFWANFYNLTRTDGIHSEKIKFDKNTNLNVSNINLTAGIRYYLNR